MKTYLNHRTIPIFFALIALWVLSPAALLAQGSSTTPQTTSSSTTTPSQSTGDKFISLTQLPGIDSFEQTSSLPDFFNNLYRLCIGAAAIIAVLQIMRAGIKFMTNKGSVSGNQAAKELIQNAILGLVLVLSPAIVFGIINPRILNLELNVSGLKPDALETLDVSSGATGDVNGDGVVNGFDSAEAQQCRANYTDQIVIEPYQSCTTKGDGYEKVANSCCYDFTTGGTCCARKKSAPGVAEHEYWWKVSVKDTGETSLRPSLDTQFGTKTRIEQSPKRFTSQKECKESYDAAMCSSFTLTCSEVTHTYCDCSKPRSEFAECKE